MDRFFLDHWHASPHVQTHEHLGMLRAIAYRKALPQRRKGGFAANSGKPCQNREARGSPAAVPELRKLFTEPTLAHVACGAVLLTVT